MDAMQGKGANELTFEEFQALRRRRQTNALLAQNDGLAGAVDDREENGVEKSGMFARLGRFLQSQEFQFVAVLVACVDVAATCAEMAIVAHYVKDPNGSGRVVEVLKYCNALSLFFFTLELLLLLFSFGGSLLGHAGYTVDIIVLTIIYYVELTGGSRGKFCFPLAWKAGVMRKLTCSSAAIRFLNVLRVWRIIRMVNAAIEALEADHRETKRLLREEREKADGLVLERKKVETALKKEHDRNTRMEQSFRAQRDELDTLREALQIAAQTVAAAQGYPLDELGQPGIGIESERKSSTGDIEPQDDESGAEDFQDTASNGSGGNIIIGRDGSFTPAVQVE